MAKKKKQPKAEQEATLAKEAPPKTQTLIIKPPNFKEAEFTIVGTVPYVQHKFGKIPKEKMRDKQTGNTAPAVKAERGKKDFQALYENAMHKSTTGWHGIPAAAFRNAMISACRTVDFAMTLAKLSIFIIADGYDVENKPLVKITKGKPQKIEDPARNTSGGADIRSRPMWREGWEAVVHIRWDGDQFKLEDVANLLMRAGVQVGIGEGRPFSPRSAGVGWGLFEIASEKRL